MSLVLIVVGVALVGVGIMFAVANKATDKAGGSGLKSITVEGPAWLVLIVVGLAATFLGVMRWEERGKTSQDRQTVSTQPTVPAPQKVNDEFPNGFTFGDDNDLDKLWRECERGQWASCDELYFQSDAGSDYEWFGATCGGIIPDPIDFCDPATE